MRTFNKMNTTDVKKARKESKELRKLKMNKCNKTFQEKVDSVKDENFIYYYEPEYEDY